MNIARVEVNLYTKALDIFVSGCRNHSCLGCHNESLWDFSVGAPYELVLPIIETKVLLSSALFDAIWLMGGEPLDQSKEDLLYFLKWIGQFEKPLVLFTGRVIQDVPEEILPYLSKIKCGPYVDTLKCSGYISHGVELASSNQMIYDLRGISS